MATMHRDILSHHAYLHIRNRRSLFVLYKYVHSYKYLSHHVNCKILLFYGKKKMILMAGTQFLSQPLFGATHIPYQIMLHCDPIFKSGGGSWYLNPKGCIDDGTTRVVSSIVIMVVLVNSSIEQCRYDRKTTPG